MKCETCGMTKDANPAHASDYADSGKHSYKGATKSADDSLLEADSPIFFGGAVKALGYGRVGGYGILFSTHEDPDVTRDYFDSETDFFFEGESKAIRPVIYDHGLDITLKSRKLGRGTVELKDAGVWVETQLALRDDYEKAIYKMAEDGKLGWSSGSAPHLIQREAVGKSQHIKSWPIVEFSLTPMPVEPRTQAVALKSYAEDRDDEPIFESLKGGPGSGPRPGGGESGGGVKHLISNKSEYDAPVHAAIGREMAKNDIDASKIDSIDIVKTFKDEQNRDTVNFRFNFKDGKSHTTSAQIKSLPLDRPMKGIFEAELAETNQHIYDLHSTLDRVAGEIVKAADVEDITGTPIDIPTKVREAVTEYAARLIPLMTSQMQDYVENGTKSGPIGGNQFYLRSFEESPLQAFLSVKSSLVSEGLLDEHSAKVVSAISEFADQCASFNDRLKSWTERCEEKIQFRASDSTKSGRTLSAATLNKLAESYEKLQTAVDTMIESHRQIGGLMEIASSKKTVSVADMFNLEAMLASARHELEMAQVPLS